MSHTSDKMSRPTPQAVKRKVTAEEDPLDACGAAKRMRSSPTKRDLILTDMPPKTIVKIFSFLHFYERSKSRGVCRRFCHAIDSMPSCPQESTLRIRLFEQAKGPSCVIRRDLSQNVVKLSINQYGNKQVDQVTHVPRLYTIRPTILDISSKTVAGVQPQMLYRLAKPIGTELTTLHVRRLASASLVELQQAFLAFNIQSKGRLSHLILEDSSCPLAHAITAATMIRGLETFKLQLTQDVLKGWQQQDSIGMHVSALQSLSHLRTLTLTVDANAFDTPYVTTDCQVEKIKATMSSIILGISAISQLQSVTCSLLCHCPESFAVLSRLPNLQYLKWIDACHVPLVGPHTQLKELGVFVLQESLANDVYEPVIVPMAVASNSFFPLLTELDMHIQGDTFALELVTKLAKLKYHPSLERITFTFSSSASSFDVSSFLKRCRYVLGDRIKVRVYTE